MSKVSGKVIKDPKRLSISKQRELSTERIAQKLNKTENAGISTIKAKQSVKTSIVNKTIPKPSTSRTSLTTNKNTAPAATKMSPTKKIPSTKLKNSDKRSTPITPPSSRVTKTQYFPSKNMYSNAVKEHKQMKSKSPVREEERPKTATLRKGSIVNSNIVGPDVPRSETSSSISIEMEDGDYEDDFDSYESDFEAYESSSPTSSINSEILDQSSTSSSSASLRTTPKQTNSAGLEEERQLDSGNYDLPENKYKLSLTNIKESSEKFTADSNRSNMASLSDEGFEDGKSLQTNVSFINFAQAQKRIKQNRHLEKQRKRGEELLSMIKLDNSNFTLFEMVPVSYDVFIKSFGNTNAIQTTTQTGEDNTNEEIQTDYIDSTTKWTQFPVTFSKIDCSDPNYLELYKQDHAGVGSDNSVKDNLKEPITDDISHQKYTKGLIRTSQIILNLLYESRSSFSEKFEQNTTDLPFSIGYVNFNTQSFPFLKNKPITLVAYCSVNKILTVHGVKKNCNVESDESASKSVICIWNVLNSKEPEKILNVPGRLNSCCCFENNMVVGGLTDGSLALWHLGNSNKSFNNNSDGQLSLEQPIYVTEINTAHTAKVVAVKQLLIKDATVLFTNNSSNQICSLDETGVLIIWVIIHKLPTHDQNVLYWNQLSLVQNLKMCLTDSYPELINMLCTDMLVNFLDTYHIFISTNYGCILHCLTNASKARPKKYLSSSSSEVNCLVSCPFSPQYFLAGHNDGSVHIYSSLHERSLTSFSNKEDNLSGVEFLQWSYTKPGTFYVKDYSNMIHVWDLKSSDLSPMYSVPFKEKITAMKLSNPQMKEKDTPYMILATDNGYIHLHILESQNKKFNLIEYESDVKKFLNYVNRL